MGRSLSAAGVTADEQTRVAAIASSLVKKGIHPSLASQAAADILVFYPNGGTLRVTGDTIEVIPKVHQLL